ncbi:MAG: CHAD domain-containing protein [Anaerolineales bacterium]|nr:CHAD domain-containing protein [Anaerolineales bacterium]
MNAKTLLLDSLNTRWDKYKAELKTCRHEFSEEAVHDFRVAARRLLSSLDLLRAVMQEPRIQKMRRILKDQLDELDDLRDIQALLADISETIHDAPVLQPFQEYLQGKEKKLLRTARKEIKSLKIASLSKRIQKLKQIIEVSKQDNLELSLFSAVDEAYAIVNQRYALVDPSQPATIHRLRIAFKKFRYMIEAIHPILQNLPVDYLKRMHDYQASMGDIQDMEVALQLLTDFGELAPASYHPEPVRSYYKERHALALSRYIEDKGEVITFWRNAPDQPFPQEK